MTTHRNEVDNFLDYDTTKVNTTIDMDSMTHNTATMEVQYQESLNPDRGVIAEANIEVEFDEQGKLDTTSLEMVNQNPELFMAVLQEKYDKEGEGQQVDPESNYDVMFMEALAGRVQEDIEHDLGKVIEYENSLMELDPADEGIEVEFDMEGEGSLELVEGTKDTYHFTQDVSFGDDSNAVAFRVTPSEDGELNISSFDENGQDMNQDVAQKIEASFDSKYDEHKVREFVKDEVMPSLTETARDSIEDAYEAYKDELEVEEPKKKQKKSRSLGMSM